jgi:hypothetical protein
MIVTVADSKIKPSVQAVYVLSFLFLLRSSFEIHDDNVINLATVNLYLQQQVKDLVVSFLVHSNTVRIVCH